MPRSRRSRQWCGPESCSVDQTATPRARQMKAREDLPAPILRSDVLSLDDLKPGMNLKGTVRNVVDFGAFVDIGVKNDGLLHRSQWPNPPNFAAGDVIEVTILQVEAERGRISLGWID